MNIPDSIFQFKPFFSLCLTRHIFHKVENKMLYAADFGISDSFKNKIYIKTCWHHHSVEIRYINVFIVFVLREWWMVKWLNKLSAMWYNKLVRTTCFGHVIILWRVNLIFHKSQIQMVIVFLIPVVICPFLVFPKFIVCIVYRQKANFRTFLSPKLQWITCMKKSKNWLFFIMHFICLQKSYETKDPHASASTIAIWTC